LEPLKWTDKLAIGHSIIDDHHQKLLELINGVLSQKPGAPVIIGTLIELIDYTRYHFLEEEKIMLNVGYPEINAHRKSHEKLTAEVIKIYNNYIENALSISNEQLFKFLSRWLIDHIFNKDHLIKPYL